MKKSAIFPTSAGENPQALPTPARANESSSHCSGFNGSPFPKDSHVLIPGTCQYDLI